MLFALISPTYSSAVSACTGHAIAIRGLVESPSTRNPFGMLLNLSPCCQSGIQLATIAAHVLFRCSAVD